MRYLMEHRTHPSIDQIFSDLAPSIPTLSKTTVYNTLKLFIDKHAAKAITIDEKNVRYDYVTSDHAHFKCRICGKIHDIPLDKSEIPSFRGYSGFNAEETQVYFVGVCNKCVAL